MDIWFNSRSYAPDVFLLEIVEIKNSIQPFNNSTID
jgi:hypothetical protein